MTKDRTAYTRQWEEQNKERRRAEKKKWQQDNREKVKQKTAERRKADPDLALKREAERREKNREEIRANQRAYAARVREKLGAPVRQKRNALLLRATPQWLTAIEKAAMVCTQASAVMLSATTGELHCVDHIIPLDSPEVCGLHVPWNLQVTSKSKNSSKGNRNWPDRPESLPVARPPSRSKSDIAKAGWTEERKRAHSARIKELAAQKKAART